jgi:RNA polymerase sigma factor (sigma-70 family)
VSTRNGVEHETDPELRFEPLFQANYQAIYRYCVRRLGRADAEDAAADVFAVAWRRIDQMPSGESSRAWLFGVAHRVVGNQYRSRRRRTGLSARLSALRGSEYGGNEIESSQSGDVDLLLMALDELSSSDRELLRLSSWDGLTRSEIAYVLGIRENAVDQRLHRARARLKTRFEILDGEPSKTETKEAPA